MLLWAANLPAEAPSGTSIQPQPKDQTCAISGVVVRKDDKAPLKGADVQLENDEDRDRERTIAAKACERERGGERVNAAPLAAREAGGKSGQNRGGR